MSENSQRADAALVARGLCASRQKAQALIEAGLATINGQVIVKPAQKVFEGDTLEVTGAAHPYVGRGGLKLERALRAFEIDPADRVCMDIGASTGGFTDVLLQNGAKKVYAIDVGSGQLDPALAANPRVVSMERTNARTLTADMFPEAPTLGVMDVSFISIRLILPAALRILGESGRFATLVKPQFEAGRAAVGKGGIVSKPAAHIEVLTGLVDFLPTLGWRVRAMEHSPIMGGDGNIEYLADLVPASRCPASPTPAELRGLVERAHAAFRHR